MSTSFMVRGIIVFGFLFLAGLTSAAPPPGPCGIFALGDTRYVAGEIGKFDYDFVAGYTLRVPWTDLETWDSGTQSPVYNFTRIDNTLEELRTRGKRMTLEIFISQVPSHVLTKAGTVTWNNPHPTFGGTQVVPWDTNALTAYAAFMQALSSHVVAGTSWRIADHPVLQSVDASIVGLQGLREVSGVLVKHPAYTRDGFIEAVVQSVRLSREAFPGKYGFLALFLMEDNVSSPSLDDTILARLLSEFNQPGKPTLGFFQETLSDTGPSPAGVGALLATASTQTYTLLQALRPWELNARDNGVRPPEIASATPLAGLERAWTQFSAPYVELYGADIINTANHEGLRRWSRFLRSVDDARQMRSTLTLQNSGTGGALRLTWPAEPLLTQRLWGTTDLVTWTQEDPGEPIDGDVTLPAISAGKRKFYRVESLMPTR
ncbi:MAG: hypothetical protein H2172_11485 [Opitutus sp.]|nr:hypothetical protein [Opitutus sp.]MCS6247899.1 hypothetical protein [Opitutus sp.]MCS6274986.1 hypothetical protein [Opitutus sp.]MCS6276970.1 hypothetical protein [Opitutus sp.]MCS6299982.1 hypothetical protein [Opitutus sp.]